MSFQSFAKDIYALLNRIVFSDLIHAKWVNTLSYLENCGARKIAQAEHPIHVREEVLKHAAEEFRHAHYLKRQIGKIYSEPFVDYSLSHLLGGTVSRHYLQKLDLFAVRYLRKKVRRSKTILQRYAYLFVTYAIEKRAEELYPIYHNVLQNAQSNIRVKSILLEEEEHLKEMEEGMQAIPLGILHAKTICAYEATLCSRWLETIKKEIA